MALALVARADIEADQIQTRAYRYLMGTSMRVEAIGGSAEDRNQAAEEAFGAIAEVDRLMSDYRDDSELTFINRNAASGPVPVSAPTFAVLATAARVSSASAGAFDVTVGPLMQLWGFKDKQPRVPTPGELDRVKGVVGAGNIVLDSRAQTVRFARPGVAIDLGGIAKGFASELAAAALQRRGLSGLVDAGGNQYLVGHPLGKSTWSIGIRSPESADKLLGVIDVSDGALSTTSDASNFLVAGGVRYGHVLDPRLLRPSDAALSATVVSKDGTLADALSKAAFVLGPKDGLELLESIPGAAGVIAYRGPNGKVSVAVSPSLAHAFHPVAP
jgi:thiamine biosynthesis lipoprotein